MLRISKQNIIGTVVAMTVVFLIYTLHFHGEASIKASSKESSMSSQVNLRGKDTPPSMSPFHFLHQIKQDIGEFGSPVLRSDVVEHQQKEAGNNTTPIKDTNINFPAHEEEPSQKTTDEQFAIDNIRQDPSVAESSSQNQSSPTFILDMNNNNSSVSDVVENIPTVLPTQFPSKSLAPTYFDSNNPTTVTVSPLELLTPAPTIEPPFQAKVFNGNAEKHVYFEHSSKSYASVFQDSSVTNIGSTDFLDSSPTEIVHNALKKGYLKSSQSDLVSDSSFKEALTDLIDSFHPGMAVFFGYGNTFITDLASSLAKTFNNFPILLNLFPGSSPFTSHLPVTGRKNIITRHHTAFSSSAQLPNPLNCIQILEDLNILVQEQLPFEFEETIGDFLCQCNMTYIPKSLPSSSYFAVWESVEQLVASVTDNPAAKCQLAIDTGASGSSSGKYASAARYTHILVARNSSVSSIPPLSQIEANNSYLSMTELSSMHMDITSGIHLALSLTQYLASEYISNTSKEELFWTGNSIVTSKHIVLKTAFSTKDSRSLRINYNVPFVSESRILFTINDSQVISPRRKLFASSASHYEDKDEVEGNIPHVLWLSHETVGSDDMILMDMMRKLHELQQEKLSLTNEKFKPNSRVYLTKSTRLAQNRLYLEENDNYHFWMHLVKEGHLQQAGVHDDKKKRYVMQDLLQVQQMNGTLAIMGGDVGLFSTKLAVLLQQSTNKNPSVQQAEATSMMMVTVLSQPNVADIIYKLYAVMNVHRRNLIAAPSFSPAWFFAMSMSKISFDVMLLESDIFFHLLAGVVSQQSQEVESFSDEEKELQTMNVLIETLALFLSLSKVTYWKLPVSHHLWLRVLSLLSVDVQSSLGQRMLNVLVNPDAFFQQIADTLTGRYLVSVDVVQTVGEHHVRVYRIEMIPFASGRSTLHRQYVVPRGLSLFALSWLKLIPAQQKLTFQLLLQLPLWILRDSQQTNKDIQTIIDTISIRDMYLRLNQASREFEMVVQNIGHLAAEHTIGSKLSPHVSPEITTAHGVWTALKSEFQKHPAELANGKFSFMEYHSGLGLISTRLAYEYPDATIFSLEKQDENTDLHLSLADAYNVSNDAICHLEMDASSLHKNLYESPELFRFQLFFNNALKQFEESNSLDEWGKHMGAILSSALTTFVYVPNRALVSLGLYALFGVHCDTRNAPQPNVKLSQKQTLFSKKKQICVILSHNSNGVYVHPAQLLTSFFGTAHTTEEKADAGTDTNRFLKDLHHMSQLSAHPQRYFINFHSDWLLSTARAKSDGSESSVMFSPMSLNTLDTVSSSAGTAYNGAMDFPMMRCDIVNMTRRVHHHFDYARDGHSRTYTMHIGINQTQTIAVTQFLESTAGLGTLAQDTHQLDIAKMRSVVDRDGVQLYSSASENTGSIRLPLGNHPCQHHITSVRLFRDKDNWPIPYTSIYGVTLITALRMGLKTTLRDRLFNEFLRLPLYEDMAPWNIVLFGKSVDYIDYDTKDVTFDTVLPKAYQIMTVLMNYKRTVEDFKRCGSKANTVYGLPYVSDCVAPTSSANAPSCGSDLRYPVPCGDGHCHSDYISCLRALARIAEQVSQEHQQKNNYLLSNSAIADTNSRVQWAQDLASAMKAVVAKFNASSYEKIAYEDFVANLNKLPQ